MSSFSKLFKIDAENVIDVLEDVFTAKFDKNVNDEYE